MLIELIIAIGDKLLQEECITTNQHYYESDIMCVRKDPFLD